MPASPSRLQRESEKSSWAEESAQPVEGNNSVSFAPVQIEGNLPNAIDFVNEQGIVMQHEVIYERKPIRRPIAQQNSGDKNSDEDGFAPQQFEGRETYVRMVSMLKYLKKPSKGLNRDKFTDIHTQQDVVRLKLIEIITKLQQDPLNLDPQMQEQHLRQEHKKTLSASASFMKQQIKMDWSAMRDHRNKYLFATVKEVCHAHLEATDENGVIQEGRDKVGEVMLYFQKIYWESRRL
ncbi:hypothetical protein Cgig2_027651 [Carnegiea gigantea]|uniref:Uncharacterized protein n=1 Tax=Carnegiea gigantea TaxID=171969 RepID=A0A9Q1GQD8_9CARY|nr:hypothetical protein Cgig2_027651 [Carnegiea gigantea]